MSQLSKEQALQKLKQAKQHLELELITQVEYDTLKDELKHHIMSSDEDLNNDVENGFINSANIDINDFDWSTIKDDGWDGFVQIKGPFLWLKVFFGLMIARFFLVAGFAMNGENPELWIDVLINLPLVLGIVERKKWGYYVLLAHLIYISIIAFTLPNPLITGIIWLIIFTIPNFIYFKKRKGYFNIKSKIVKDSELSQNLDEITNYDDDDEDELEEDWETYTYPDGSKYVGEWEDDKITGFGTFTWANGEEYVGWFKDNQPNGEGTYTYPDGSKYVGEWKDGERNGTGRSTLSNGDGYVGEWEDDKITGFGTFTWANGEEYVGWFKDNQPNGEGTYTYPDGSKYVGEWKDGEYIG